MAFVGWKDTRVQHNMHIKWYITALIPLLTLCITRKMRDLDDPMTQNIRVVKRLQFWQPPSNNVHLNYPHQFSDIEIIILISAFPFCHRHSVSLTAATHTHTNAYMKSMKLNRRRLSVMANRQWVSV